MRTGSAERMTTFAPCVRPPGCGKAACVPVAPPAPPEPELAPSQAVSVGAARASARRRASPRPDPQVPGRRHPAECLNSRCSRVVPIRAKQRRHGREVPTTDLVRPSLTKSVVADETQVAFPRGAPHGQGKTPDSPATCEKASPGCPQALLGRCWHATAVADFSILAELCEPRQGYPAGEVVLEAETTDTAIVLQTAADLEPGEYQWWVGATSPGDTRSSLRPLRLRAQ